MFINLFLIYRKPFLKERTSDDSTHADSIINLLTELGTVHEVYEHSFPYEHLPVITLYIEKQQCHLDSSLTFRLAAVKFCLSVRQLHVEDSDTVYNSWKYSVQLCMSLHI